MKKIIINSTLILCSILLTYGLLELFFRISLPYLPVKLLNNQCRELRTIGQTSKKGKTPESPYIAIIGDSYGAGQGDWFSDNRYNLNSRYQASHVLQDITGKDVISLSRAGAGNYDGAIFAINTFRYLNRAGFDLPAPDTIVVYFYEGNDISDNVRFMRRYFTTEYEDTALHDDIHFSEFDARMDVTYCQGTLPRLQDKFLIGNLLSRTIEGMIYSATKKSEPLPPGTTYNAQFNGEEVWIPDALEVELSAFSKEDSTNAVRFLERALNKIDKTWPDSKKYLVYLPSPLTTYAFMDDNASKRLEISTELEDIVSQAAISNGFSLVDFAPKLREAALTQYLHGPKDWSHFNRAGYELLAQSIAEALKQ